ncbi:MAG: hypothetical protein ACJ74T_10060 [Pyrinomonadaceae bacterium]
MFEKKELAAKLFGVTRAACVLSLVSAGALYIYATYVNPSARADLLPSLALILLVALTASLAAASLLYLSARIKKSRPAAARNLIFLFFAVTVFSLLLLPRVFGYPVESGQILIYFLCWIGLSLALHGVLSARSEG